MDVDHLNIPDIQDVRIPNPPIDPHEKMLMHIKVRLTQIDRLLSESNQLVVLLQERHTGLISADVTGKIDVRAWQPPEPASEAGTS